MARVNKWIPAVFSLGVGCAAFACKQNVQVAVVDRGVQAGSAKLLGQNAKNQLATDTTQVAPAAAVPNPNLLVYGHRGSAGNRPENTLSAMMEGAATGATYIELDVQETKDNIVVLSHDEALEASLCRNISGTPLQNPVDIRRTLATDINNYDCGWPPEKESPPTLDAVLAWRKASAPKTKIALHIKAGGAKALAYDPKQFIPRILAVLDKYGDNDMILPMAFETPLLNEVKRLRPAMPFGFLVQTNQSFCAATKALGAAVAMPFWTLITPAEVAKCHRLGLPVVAFTVDDEPTWDGLARAGVDGIITDFPRELEQHLHPSPDSKIGRHTRAMD